MKTITNTLAMILVIVLPTLLCAQQSFVHFEYDAAGNRIERYISVTKLTEADTLLFGDDATYNIMNVDEAENNPAGSNIQVYPNPTYGMLNIDVGRPLQNTLSWYLFDQTGRVVLQGKLLQQNSTINLQPLQNGTYHFYLPETRGFKIIKQ